MCNPGGFEAQDPSKAITVFRCEGAPAVASLGQDMSTPYEQWSWLRSGLTDLELRELGENWVGISRGL
jgi:hypothetical protein